MLPGGLGTPGLTCLAFEAGWPLGTGQACDPGEADFAFCSLLSEESLYTCRHRWAPSGAVRCPGSFLRQLSTQLLALRL